MKTQSVIQQSANVVKLVSLEVGDVFKIINDGYSSPEIKYCVVTALHNSGEKSFIEVIQYEKSYSSVDASVKILKGNDDLSIFPATIEEVEEYFESAIENIEKDIKDKEKKLEHKKRALTRAKEFVSGELSKKLSSAKFLEMTQQGYLEEKAEKERKLKELEE